MIPTDFISTYCSPPRQPDATIMERAASIGLLKNAIQSHSLILIQAPSGYGKTQLIHDYMLSYSENIQYISLFKPVSEKDFWQLIFYSIKKYDFNLGKSLEAQLSQVSQGDFPQSIVSRLKKAERSVLNLGTLILVIDDIHNIIDPSTLIHLNELLLFLPNWIRFVLSGQKNPGLNLDVFLSKGIAQTLTSKQLSLGDQSSEQLFNDIRSQITGNENRTTQENKHIVMLTNGWPGAINILAKDINYKPENPSISIGSHCYTFIMLRVLCNLESEARNFLSSICMLGEFNLPLLTLTVSNDSHSLTPFCHSDMATHLQKCVQLGLIDPINPHWYRLHPLIKGALVEDYNSSELKVSTFQEHQRAACRYHLQHGHLAAALELHIDLKEWVTASNILLKLSQPLIQKGELNSIRAFLDRFPNDFIFTQPFLCLLECLFFINQYNHQQATEYLNLVSSFLAQSTSDQVHYNDTNESGIFCDEDFEKLINTFQVLNGALQRFTPGFQDASFDRESNTLAIQSFQCWHYYGECVSAFIKDDMHSCIRYGYQAISSAKNNNDLNCIIASSSWLYHGLYYNGLVDQAIELAENNLGYLTKKNGLNLANINNIYSSLCFLYIEKNHLDKAWFYYDLILTSITDFTEPREILYSKYYLHVLLLSASQQLDFIDTAIKQLKEYESNLSDKQKFTGQDDFSILVNSELISHIMNANNGNRLPLIQWALSEDVHEKNPSQFVTQYEYFLQLIGHGLSGMDVLDELSSLMSNSKKCGVLARYINGSMFKANIHLSLKEVDTCKQELTDCLATARQAGYFNLLIASSNNKELLKFALKHKIEPDYVQTLLMALNIRNQYQRPQTLTIKPVPQNISKLILSLTPRERQVLILLNQGLRNSELAQQLGLTVPTVKRHLQNIYGKLEVSSRTEAVLLCKPHLSLIEHHLQAH